MENSNTTEDNVDIMINDLRFKLCNDNYDAIMNNGIDVKEMKDSGMDIESVRLLLDEMIAIFVDVEEYEKCQNIREIIDNNFN